VEGKMGGACSTYKRKEQFTEELRRESAGRPFGKHSAVVRMILKWIFKTSDGRVYSTVQYSTVQCSAVQCSTVE
jgi:hypothetical protein